MVTINKVNDFKSYLENLKDNSWEIIIPFYNNNFPNYLTQGTCDLTLNRTGVLILGVVFINLIKNTSILEDFKIFYFYITLGLSKYSYHR